MLPRPSRSGLSSQNRPSGRSRRDESPSGYSARSLQPSESSASSRPLNSQRPPASLTNPRQRTRIQEALKYDESGSSRRYDVADQSGYRKHSKEPSSSSVSSTSSSSVNRMRGGRMGYESSLTSLEDDYEQPGHGHGAGFQSLRKERGEEPLQPYDKEGAAPTDGGGYSIWNHVATVAGSLTVDLSKAWATNVSHSNGEETPPGQESHLTRAMKAYHLEKARDPSDLPTWLFDERERRPTRSNNSRRDDDEEYGWSDKEPPRPRGLRGIYETATKVDTRSQRLPPSGAFADAKPSRSKMTDRLKELREAKRSAHIAPDRYDEPENGHSNNQRGEDRYNDSQADRRPKRVGLPSGPSARSRRL